MSSSTSKPRFTRPPEDLGTQYILLLVIFRCTANSLFPRIRESGKATGKNSLDGTPSRRGGYRSTRSVLGAFVTAPALPSVRNALGSLSLNFYLGLSLRSPRETPNHPFPTYILGPGQSSLIYSRLALKTMLL